MRASRWLLIAAVSIAPLFAGYTYDYPNSVMLANYNPSSWAFNGNGSAPSGGFYTSSDATIGSSILTSNNGGLIGPTSSYEVRTVLSLTQSGGNYMIYLRATPDALLDANSGT